MGSRRGPEPPGASVLGHQPGAGPPPELRTPPGPCRKYPAIRSGRQREGYRAVFSDQHAEYRELLGEVREARRRLGELEAAARHALGRTVSHGCPVGVPWVSHGCPMGVPWVSRGCPIGVPWVSRGCPVGVPWVSHGCRVVVPWVSLGFPMCVPRVSHRCPVGVPWVSHGCPVGVPWVSQAGRAQHRGHASGAGDTGLPLLTPQGDSGVARVWREVLRKKRDSAFLEKQRRCRYLQEKLTHIKRQIQDYDRGSAVYF
ncbi:Occludin/ELL domain-containing protein 1 [Aix galericulata]|nr:Occludin/ELL domain-containing protein 1 [Aix galericulata]